MRRLLAPCALLLAIAVTPACSFLWEASERFEQDELSLDDATPEHKVLAKVCWSGARPDGIELRVIASSPDAAGRVGVVVGTWEERVDEQPPESLPRASWEAPYEGDEDEGDLDEACMSGAEIVFTLDDPAAGAATVEWELEAYAHSSSDEAVEQLSFELNLEPL